MRSWGRLSAVPDAVVGIQVTKRVLVVDDVAEMRTLIQRVLSADGYQVDVAATLAEARGLDPAGYSAVLVDAHLGAEHGLDLIEELRSADPGGGPPVRGDHRGPRRGWCRRPCLLAKPFQAADLLDAVRTLPQPVSQPDPPPSGPPRPGPERPDLSRPDRGLLSRPRCGRTLLPADAAGPGPGPSRDRPLPSPAQIRHLLAVTRLFAPGHTVSWSTFCMTAPSRNSRPAPSKRR